MRYLVRYNLKKKKRCRLETYDPKPRIEFSKGEALPLMIRLGNKFVFLGGLAGFWASGILIGIKGIFGVKKKINRFSFNNRVVEIRVKK